MRAMRESSQVAPVARSAEDMITITNGGGGEIPPEEPEEKPLVVNQQRSSVDMTAHPQVRVTKSYSDWSRGTTPYLWLDKSYWVVSLVQSEYEFVITVQPY